MANFAVANRARGVIGSRARLRIWCLTTWGFESLRAHPLQSPMTPPRVMGLDFYTPKIKNNC